MVGTPQYIGLRQASEDSMGGKNKMESQVEEDRERRGIDCRNIGEKRIIVEGRKRDYETLN